MGVTFLALAPEHDFIAKYADFEETEKIDSIKKKPEVQRKVGKSTVLLKKLTAIHPITKAHLPVFVAEYVLIQAGTGCIMGVPGHDDRDKILSCEHNLPIIKVIEKNNLINSADFTGLTIEEAKQKISKMLNCKEKVNYRIKDWLVSRQRYWGVPIPIVHCKTCGPVAEKNLPLKLPKQENKNDWLLTDCPTCKKPAIRESDTLDTFFDSSWYYLRYIDSKNSSEICDKTLAKL